MESRIFEAQKRDELEDHSRPDGLYQATNDPRERGPYPGHVQETSVYTKAVMNPVLTGALMLAAGIAATQYARSRQ
jgi:hypothetical protein